MNKHQFHQPTEMSYQPHFSLRKLSVGLASVLLGTSIYVAQGTLQTVKADTVTNDSRITEVNSEHSNTQQSEDASVTNSTISAYKATNVKTNKTSPDNQKKPINNSQREDFVSSDTASINNSNVSSTNTNTSNQTNTNQTNVNSDTSKNNSMDTNNTESKSNSSDSNTNITNDKDKSKNNIPANNLPDTNNQQIVTNITDNDSKNPVSKIIKGKWNGLDTEFDTDTSTLTVHGGTITDPKPLSDNIDDPTKVLHVNFADHILIYGDAIGMLGNFQNVTDFIGLENLDTKNITNMDYMFSGDKSITKLDLDKFDTAGANSMNNMFANCEKLSDFSLENFNTQNVQFMMHMFENCKSITSLDLSSFKTPNLKDISYMFKNATNIKDLKISNLDVSNVEFMMYTFQGMSSITNLDLSTWNTSNVTDMSYMFYNCTNLNQIITDKFDTSKVVYMMHMFDGAFAQGTTPVALDLTGFDTSNVTDMSYMFNNCTNLQSINLSSFDVTKVQYMNYMFNNCSSLMGLDLHKFTTKSVTDISYMFSNTAKLEFLDLSGFDTSNVIYFMHMFENAASLTALDLANFNTKNGLSFSYMFANCANLKDLNIPNFDLSSAQYSNNMFAGCTKLGILDVSNFGKNNIISMTSMFEGCTSLIKLDLRNFVTNYALYMSKIFNGCTNLAELYINSFDLSKSIDYTNMLMGLNNLSILGLGKNLRLVGTGLNTPKSWVRVAGGTVFAPKGDTLYTSAELMRRYNGATDADTYVHTNLPEYQISIQYRDLDSNITLLTDTQTCAPTLITSYRDTLNNNLKNFEKLGYVFSEKDTTLPLNSNQDILIKKDAINNTYIIGLRHKILDFGPSEPNPVTGQNDDINLIKEIKQTIKYQGAPNAIPDDVQTIKFTRIGHVDQITGKVTYGDWNKSQATFADVTSPTVPGYKVSDSIIKGTTVTVNDANIEKTVTYTRIPVNKLKVEFIDQDNNNEQIANTSLTGESLDVGKPITKPAGVNDMLDKLKAAGYEIVTDPFENPALALDGEQTVTYVLKHHKTTLSKHVQWQQVVHFVSANNETLFADNVQTVNALKTGTRDEVTKNETWSDGWTYDNSIKDVKVPVINGYIADKTIVTAQPIEINDTDVQTKDNSNTVEINVNYTKLGSIIPVNSKHERLNGHEKIFENDPIDPTKIKTVQTAPVIDGYAATDTNLNITDPTADYELVYLLNNKTTINFIDQDDNNQAIKGIDSIVTTAQIGQTIKKPEQLASILAKLDKQGYQLVVDPFQNDVTAIEGEQNLTYMFKHKLNNSYQETIDRTQTVHFVDKQGKALADDQVTKLTFTHSGVQDLVTGKITWNNWTDEQTFADTKAPVIKGYITDKAIITGATISHSDTNQDITVTYYHVGKVIPLDPEWNRLPNVDPIDYVNNATDPTMVEAIVPEIPGYTPVSKNITINDPKSDTNVFYKSNNRTISHFVDQDDNNKPLSDSITEAINIGQPITRTKDVSDRIDELESKGYILVSDPLAKPIVATGDTQEFTYIFKHSTDNLVKESITRKQIIHFVDANGKALKDDYVVEKTFTRQGTKDLVTQVITWSDWSKAQALDDVKVPVVNGYIASQNKVTNQVITADKNVETTITYQTVGKIIPVDSNGQVLTDGKATSYENDPNNAEKIKDQQQVPTIPGYTPVETIITPTDATKDTKVTYLRNNQTVISFIDQDNDNKPIANIDTITISNKVGHTIVKPNEVDTVLAKLSKQGYELVKDPFAQSVTAGEGNQNLVYVFKHKQSTITDHIVRKQVVHFVDTNGKALASDNIQTIEFTRTGTKDEVTGSTNWGKWQISQLVKAVDVPVVKGYLAKQKQVANETITPDKDVEISVAYQKVGKIVPVDENKKPIANVEQPDYENDPIDPTKVKSEQVPPKIKGYHTKTDTVIPTDATQNTLVIYQKDATPMPPVIEDNANLDIIIHDDTINQDLTNYHWNSGKVVKGDKVTYDWNKVKQDLISHGYEIVNEPTIPTNYHDAAQIITIHVKHGQVTISAKKPQIAGNNINQGNAKWPAQTQYMCKYKYVVKFVDKHGHELHPAKIQSMRFSRTLIIDAVTGDILNPTASWVAEYNNYADVTAPNIKGYQVAPESRNQSTLINHVLLGPVAMPKDMTDEIIYLATNKHIVSSSQDGKDNQNNHGSHVSTNTSTQQALNDVQNATANNVNKVIQKHIDSDPNKASLLPQTGQNETEQVALLLIGVTMSAISAGLYSTKKKRH